VQEVHGVEALPLARLGGTEVAHRWLAMASRAVVTVESKAEQRMSELEGDGQNGAFLH
jgi:hypothetical protein